MRVLITGDVHGNFVALRDIINKECPDMTICCGDFGYWPGYRTYEKDMEYLTRPPTCPIHFCDGNHERHDLLEALTTNEIAPEVFYMKRGSYLYTRGKTFLFFGGANSIDKSWRTPGVNWFYRENISETDMMHLPDIPIDIVISHTCPLEFDLGIEDVFPDKDTISNRKYLSMILERYKPAEWYFGHWHLECSGVYNNTKYWGLDTVSHKDTYGYTIIEI